MNEIIEATTKKTEKHDISWIIDDLWSFEPFIDQPIFLNGKRVNQNRKGTGLRVTKEFTLGGIDRVEGTLVTRGLDRQTKEYRMDWIIDWLTRSREEEEATRILYTAGSTVVGQNTVSTDVSRVR